MKFKLKAALAAVLALIMALASVPVSALPKLEAVKIVDAEPYTVPAGYNAHDYEKCVAFLSQADSNGVKNGRKLDPNFDPEDPSTWGTCPEGLPCFEWETVNGENMLKNIHVEGYLLTGNFDFSGCTELVLIFCFSNWLTAVNVSNCSKLYQISCQVNRISELDLTGCPELEVVSCWQNIITEVDVSENPKLLYLLVYENLISEIDISNNPVLISLVCGDNKLSDLDLSANTEMIELDISNNSLTNIDISPCADLCFFTCRGNRISEFDLSANVNLGYEHIAADGNGFVGLLGYNFDSYFGRGLSKQEYQNEFTVYAYPESGEQFEGFFDESGELVSQGEWSEQYGAYIYAYNLGSTPSGRIFARFSGGAALPGDVDGNGSVSVADAITTLRLAMQLLDGSGMNTDAADMDGNGSITIADAIVILRTAMGLA